MHSDGEQFTDIPDDISQALQPDADGNAPTEIKVLKIVDVAQSTGSSSMFLIGDIRSRRKILAENENPDFRSGKLMRSLRLHKTRKYPTSSLTY